MSDREIQERVREAGASSDPAAALVAGRALLRAGRRDEAVATLWPARRSPEVLRELSALVPSWSHAEGDAGGTASIDSELPRALPGVRWSFALPERPGGLACGTLAGAGGVAVAREGGTLLLDPDDGQVVKELREVALQWDGELLVVRLRDTVQWLRLDGGSTEVVHELADLDGQRVVAHGGLVALVGEKVLRMLARGPRGFEERWRWKLKRKSALGSVVFAPGLVLVQGIPMLRRVGDVQALDATSGAERWTLRSGIIRADAAGFVRISPEEPEATIVATDFEGRELWRFSRPAWQMHEHAAVVQAIDAASVVAGDGTILDRRTGVERGIASVWRAHWLLGRDVVVCWTDVEQPRGTKVDALRPPFIAAFSTSGDALWAFDREWLGQAVHRVASVAGRLYVRTPTRVICLESPDRGAAHARDPG